MEDIAANQNYYFVAEGSLYGSKKMSVYDPTSKQLLRTIKMTNGSAPKRWDSELIVSTSFALLDVKFRDEATGKERFNINTILNISGPPSEWGKTAEIVL